MWERRTWYPNGMIVEDTTLMQWQIDACTTLFQFILDALGSTSSIYTGLAATPGTGLQVVMGTGALYQYGLMDPTTWSDMPTNSWEGMLPGLLLAAQTLDYTFAAPTTSGQSIDYLIEAQIQVTDSATDALPFSNGATPPSAVTQNLSPSRQNLVVFQVKPGAAATSGDQTAPTADSGWVPLYVVTVAYGETQIVTGNITAASGAPKFYGFVQINPSGNTPVYLSPASQQSGSLNISGEAQVGSIVAADALFGGASSVSHYDGAWANGFSGDYLNLTAIGWTGSVQDTDSLDIAGSIGYTGSHAGTDDDPYPLSMLNVAMLGGKVASDYALASGNYIIVYSGTPTLASGNAGITGYFQSSLATGTAPFVVASTTMVENLNAEYLAGYAAGNASGDIPVANGTLCDSLNAELLNGEPGSYYQPAGDYAEMNDTNTGSFSSTGTIGTTGGTGSAQATLGYEATNDYGINSNGALSYLSSPAFLALIASGIYTTGPLSVGSPNSPQNLSAQDIVPSGIMRSGLCVYTVTYSTSSTYPTPGSGTPYGTYESQTGQIVVSKEPFDSTKVHIGFRVKITVNASTPLSFNGVGYGWYIVYIDGVELGATTSSPTTTLSIGQHTIDLIYTPQSYTSSTGAVTWGGGATLFGWIPMNGSQIASSITELVPG